MFSRHLIRPSWIVFSCTATVAISITLDPAHSQGQDAQRKGQAKVAHQLKEDKDRETATPSDKGTALSDDAASKDNNASRDARAKKLARRAGEQVGDDPKGRALVLGMSLQEADSGRVKVVEVGATTPAFDGGIREGDELLSFHGFSAESYRKWIDGMRRLTTDAPDGSTIPVVVLRDGRRMALRIRVPEAKADDLRQPLAQRVAPQSQPSVGPGTPVPFGPTGVGNEGNGGNDVFIDNGPFGDFFGDQSTNAAERAMAQLFRVGGPATTVPAGSNRKSTGAAGGTNRAGTAQLPAATTGAAAPDQGMRIGLAGFRNDPTGMLVMVDIGGLKPGNYSVGISDPGLIGGQTAPGVVPPPSVDSQPGVPPQPLPPPTPAIQRPVAPQPGATRPSSGGRGISQPQSNLQPAPENQIPKTVLAQVADSGQASGAANPSTSSVGAATTQPGTTIPPTGQLTPSTVPPTGQVNPSDTTPTGQSRVNNALLDQANNNVANATGASATGNGMLNQIGVLTVDQSGTGRMQQVVEGVQVRDVVGQAIVIYAQGTSPQTTLPPNLDATADPAPAQSVPASGAARGVQGVVDQPQGAAGAATPGAVAGQPATAAQTPVAAGIISLISDRRPPTNGIDATGNVPVTDQGLDQPVNNTPAGTNPNTGQ